MQRFSSLASAALIGTTLLSLAAASASRAEEKIYSLSELDVVKQVVPDYPHRARHGRFEGWVELEFTVTPSGEVSEAEVIDSSSRIFHRDALVALQRWRFEPVAVSGQPAPVRAHLRFTFAAD